MNISDMDMSKMASKMVKNMNAFMTLSDKTTQMKNIVYMKGKMWHAENADMSVLQMIDSTSMH